MESRGQPLHFIKYSQSCINIQEVRYEPGFGAQADAILITTMKQVKYKAI